MRHGKDKVVFAEMVRAERRSNHKHGRGDDNSQLFHTYRNSQDHLEECSNEDKCDLRFVVELSGRRATLLMALSFLRPFLFRARENALGLYDSIRPTPSGWRVQAKGE